jgi:hypothetical protein
MIKLLVVLLLIFNGIAQANPPGTFQPLLLNTKNPLTITNTDSASQASASNTTTFTNKLIGVANSGRLVSACVAWRSNGTETLTSATIGGISATITLPNQQQTPTYFNVAIIRALVPTGLTANFTLNYSGNLSGSGAYTAIAVYSILPTNSTISSDYATGTGTTSISLNTDVNLGGVIMACGFSQASSARGFTGLTKNGEINTQGSDWMQYGSDMYSVAQAPVSITATSTGGNQFTAISAAFNPL